VGDLLVDPTRYTAERGAVEPLRALVAERARDSGLLNETALIALVERLPEALSRAWAAGRLPLLIGGQRPASTEVNDHSSLRPISSGTTSTI
jgi:hypothetical protein